MAPYTIDISDGGLSRAALAACIFIATVLCVICILPPNPTAERANRNGVGDHLHIPVVGHASLRFVVWAVFTIAAAVHGVLISMFAWNPKLALILGATGVAAAIRIAAFRNLGVDFTFNLRQPSGLVKTGIHRYVQHPSYTGLLPVMSGIVYIYLRADGLAACYLPAEWVGPLVKLQPLLVASFVAALTGMFLTRVADEERMLRKAFGKEWEEYHRTTKRFIPGVV